MVKIIDGLLNTSIWIAEVLIVRRKVAVTGGKGGTGKSTLAVNLAVELSKRRETVLADLDVEAPNDHILLSVDLANDEEVYVMVPFFDYEKCTGCGVCARVCSEGAILMGRDRKPFLLPRLCSGCRACYFACPFKAITEGKRLIGHTYETHVERGGGFKLVTGVLNEGEESSFPVVLAARERAVRAWNDVLLVDTAAGTGNSVGAALDGSDLIIAVTEPTPLGAHDLDLILELAEYTKAETWVVLNRAGIGDEKVVMEALNKHKAKLVAKIPFTRDITESYVKGVPIVEYNPESPASKAILNLVDKVLEVL